MRYSLWEIGLRSSDKTFVMHQNRPNPFVEETVIRFNLPESDQVEFQVYNQSGKPVMTKVFEGSEGENMIQLRRADLKGTGVMFYTLKTKFGSQTKKLTLLD